MASGVTTVLCSSVQVASSPEVAALEQAGCRVIVASAGSVVADVLVSARGGALAFLLWRETAGTMDLVERATAAARSSRRCTILWVASAVADGAVDALQAACPPDVNALLFDHSRAAGEHLLACVRAVTAAPPLAEQEAHERATMVGEHFEAVAARLAVLWGCGAHDVQFLLTACPLPVLARVSNRDEWHRLLLETEALGVKPELLSRAVEWLHRDGPQRGLVD